MKQVLREKIALLVFCLVLLVSLGALVAYILVGHSWNVVATQVDDAASDMEGYVAILYEGTQTPELREGNFESDPPVSLAGAVAAYREKGANVLSFDATNPAAYVEPTMFRAGDTRVLLVYLPDVAAHCKELRSQVAVAAKSADVVVGIAPSSYVGGTYSDVQVVIDLNEIDEAHRANEEMQYIENCGVGSIGAVLISPSGVVSDRTVRSL